MRGVAHAVLGAGISHKALAGTAFHNGGVVAVGHHRVLGRHLLSVAYHAEQRFVLFFPINGELGIENLMATVFAIGLREHHQFHIGGVAPCLGKSVNQVVNLIDCQRQAPVFVGLLQSRFATAQYIHLLHGHRLQMGEQLLGIGQRRQDAFGHAVMQQSRNGLLLFVRQLSAVQEVFGTTLNAARFGQTTVARNIGGFTGPW